MIPEDIVKARIMADANYLKIINMDGGFDPRLKEDAGKIRIILERLEYDYERGCDDIFTIHTSRFTGFIFSHYSYKTKCKKNCLCNKCKRNLRLIKDVMDNSKSRKGGVLW